MKSGSRARAPGKPAALPANRPVMVFGLPVECALLFSNHRGVYKQNVEKRQRRLIAKIGFIKFFLQHEESIRYLTIGCSPVGRLGRVLAAASLAWFKRAILVFTDRRILLIPASYNLCPHHCVSQIRYADCFDLALKRSSLRIRYKTGASEIFPQLIARDKKKIRSIIEDLPQNQKQGGRTQGRVHLCPGCATNLDSLKAVCPKCGLIFKTGMQAAARSLLIPGGGYFYSRHPWTGGLVGFAEVLFLTALVVSGMGLGPDAARHFGQVNLLLLSGSALTLIKLIALSHSRKLIGERMPARREFPIRKI